jgi:hypothetical protein
MYFDNEGTTSIWVTAGNAEHRERTDSPGKDWEHAGNKTGNPGNIFISHDPPIAPLEPVPLTLPVAHPALRPQATSGTNLVCLCPLRLGLIDASLQDLRNRRALFALQPRSNHLFPRIAFVTRFLLIAGLCSAINPFAVESTSCQQMCNVVTSRLGRRYVGNPPNP